MSSAARGTPDWQNSFGDDTGDYVLLPACADAALYFALPRLAALAERSDGSPDFFLEFVSDRNGAGPEDSLYASVHLGLERGGSLEDAHRLVAERSTGAALMPAALGTGTVWHLECGRLHKTSPFAWTDAQRASIYARLSPEMGTLLYGALAQGAVQVAKAALECEMAALLPRIEATVTFETARLVDALCALGSGDGSVPFRRMETYLNGTLPGLLHWEGDDAGASGRSRGLALAGRIRSRFGRSAPCPRITDGPHVVLSAPPGTPGERTTWDLRTPVLAGIPVFLDFDPFTPVVGSGARDQVTHFTRVPPLPDDLRTERVSVASGLPPNIQGCEAVELTLYAAAEHSPSKQGASHVVPLYPWEGGTAAVELKFRRSVPQAYRGQVRVVGEDGSVTEQPWFDFAGDYLYIDAQALLPSTCVTVRATTRLLAQARVSLQGPGNRQGTLTTDTPALTFLAAPGEETARLTVTALDPGDSANAPTLDLPFASTSLDLSSFRQFGPQRVKVEVKFRGTAQQARLEFLPECADDEPVVLAFRSPRGTAEFAYFSTHLFRHRYRFRRVDEDPERTTRWSELQPPDRPLTVVIE
jgi:hypothetical protein